MQVNYYEKHVELNKQLKMTDDFNEVRAPYKEDFEKIYNKSKEENVNISNAKDFLNSLSKEELVTLQNFTRLADEINVEKLNDEGAYNLLLHHYEKYDFNNDGVISDGIGNRISMLPQNMPNDEKKVLIETLNDMDDKSRFLTLALLNPPKLVLNDDGSYGSIASSEIMTYEKIMERIEQLINPAPPSYSSFEVKDTFSKFKEAFESNFNELKEQKQSYKSSHDNEVYLNKAKIMTAINI